MGALHLSLNWMLMPLRLSDITPGQSVRISGLEERPVTSRLLAMGLRPGVSLTVVRQASGGQTIYLETAQQQFGIRKDEAMQIWVENAL